MFLSSLLTGHYAGPGVGLRSEDMKMRKPHFSETFTNCVVKQKGGGIYKCTLKNKKLNINIRMFCQ